MSSVLTYASAEDWCGLYIDDKLAVEGHSLYPPDLLLSLVGVEVREARRICIDDEWLGERGFLPESVSDIPEEAIV